MSPMPLHPPEGVLPPPDAFNFARHLLETNAGRASMTSAI